PHAPSAATEVSEQQARRACNHPCGAASRPSPCLRPALFGFMLALPSGRRAWRIGWNVSSSALREGKARMHQDETSGAIRHVALLGNYLPRRCGIATFTTDLATAISQEFTGITCGVVA